LIEKAGNQLPGVTVVRMENFEADFIPYYLTTRELVPMDDSVLHLIYSNDHDLWQCARNNVCLYSKTPTAKKIIRENQAMSLILKQDCNLHDSFLPLAMSILGDPGDDVPGVKGVGPKRLYPILNELIELVGDMNQVYTTVRNGSGLFDGIDKEIKNKYLNSVIEDEKLNKTVSRNLKLVSFELISRFLDEPTSTEALQKRKHIEAVLDNECKLTKDSIQPALEKCGVMIENDALDFIYT
jgi:5'-3' exonuclease